MIDMSVYSNQFILCQAAQNERQEAALSNISPLMTFNTGDKTSTTGLKYPAGVRKCNSHLTEL